MGEQIEEVNSYKEVFFLRDEYRTAFKIGALKYGTDKDIIISFPIDLLELPF
jgi:hypothetical protein